MSDKIRVNLASNTRDYVGVLFEAPTGIIYSNQIGGTSCCHPSVEGFFVLLSVGAPESSFDPLYDIHPDPYTNEDKAKVAALIQLLGLDKDLEAPDLDECPEGQEIGEAWVPIKVRADAQGREGRDGGSLHELKGRIGILTYPNSD